jgi:hypothetical protein
MWGLLGTGSPRAAGRAEVLTPEQEKCRRLWEAAETVEMVEPVVAAAEAAAAAEEREEEEEKEGERREEEEGEEKAMEDEHEQEE